MNRPGRTEPDGGPAPERLFLAIDLPESARRELAAAVREIQLPGRSVPPSNWHITLRFLGDVPPRAGTSLVRELAQTDLGQRFDLGLRGGGAFPRGSRASVLWIGTDEETSRLEALAFEVRDAARRAGFPPDEKPFHPHLTISRLRVPVDARRYLDALAGVELRTPVDEVVLFRSTLGAGTPRYDRLAAIPLATP